MNLHELILFIKKEKVTSKVQLARHFHVSVKEINQSLELLEVYGLLKQHHIAINNVNSLVTCPLEDMTTTHCSMCKTSACPLRAMHAS